MRVRIKKGVAKGKIQAPASKSMAHRLLICAALSEGKSIVRRISFCQDVLATIDCIHALGVKTEIEGDNITVYGINIKDAVPQGPLLCRESGSTLRFMIPVAMLTGKTVIFQGTQSLMHRPMTIYEDLFTCKYYKDDEGIKVSEGIESGEYIIPGNISSQFISGLLFALPLLAGDSVIKIVPPLESRSYIDLTIQAMKEFNVFVEWTDDYTITIKGNQAYASGEVTVEGDYSSAAFMEALNAFGGNVQVEGLNEYSKQGDRVYKEHFSLLNSGYTNISLENCPDLAPILFAVASAKNGGTFTNTRRLKIKESDRGETMAQELRKFGANIIVNEDSVVIKAATLKKPNESIYGHNDHRIVMANAILLTLTGGEIEGAEAITKSYPDFFSDLRKVGIEVEKI